MKKNWFMTFIIAIFIVGVIGFAIYSPRYFKKEDSRKTASTLNIKERIITAKGVVESEEEIEINSQVDGRILEIRGEEGKIVKKDQPLVILDNEKILAKIRVVEAMFREAKARLNEIESGSRAEDVEMAKSRVRRAEVVYEKAKEDYEREERLYQKNGTTLIELNRAKERMNVMFEELNESKNYLRKLESGARKEEINQVRATVERFASDLKYHQLMLKDYTICSPIDGMVIERFKDANEIVNIGSPILKLINLEKLRVRAELEESDIGKVVEGQLVEIESEAFKEKKIKGRVYKVIQSVKRKAQKTFDPLAAYDINTQDIYIKLDDFSGLKNGMSVTVRFMK